MATSGCEKSSWTPLNHAPSNQKLFTERLDLIKRWFSHWTELQRKAFLESLLPLCSKAQLDLLHHHLVDGKPVERLDFTRFLPRCISLYIFTFLDPRSLCRASRVCWYWKMLTETDGLWAPKCLRYTWRLSYFPSQYEQGAWKRLYIEKVKSLQYVPPPAKKDPPPKKPPEVKHKPAKEVDRSKLVWRDPDKKPVDLEKLSRKILYEDSQNLTSHRRSSSRRQGATTPGKAKDSHKISQKSFPRTSGATSKLLPSKHSSGNHANQTFKAGQQVDTVSMSHQQPPGQLLGTLSSTSLNATQSDSALLDTAENVDSSNLLSRIAIQRPKTQATLRRRSRALRRSLQDLPSAPLFTDVPTVVSRSADGFANG